MIDLLNPAEPVTEPGAEPPQDPPVAPPTDSPRAARRLPTSARWLVAASGLVAALTRIPGFDRPRVMVFDEVFYAVQGLEVADSGVETGSTVHPPLAKWAIGAGVRVFGFDAFGWRIVPLLAGIAVVMLTVAAACRLLQNLWLAGVAGLVVLTDGIAFTSGRLALLDGIVALFTTAALLALATTVARPLDVPLRRRSTWAVGLLLGAGLACKWSVGAILPVATITLAVLAWRTSPRGRDRRWELARIGLITLLVPVGVYCVTYLPTLANFDDSAIGRRLCHKEAVCEPSLVRKVEAIVDDHRSVLRFHQNLEPTNKYAHSAVSWVFQTEPVGLLKSRCPSADPACDPSDGVAVRRIIGIGNPVIWALATLALLVGVVLALWRLDLRLGLAVSWAMALWLPWIVMPTLTPPFVQAARPGYTFYATPLVPALGIVLAFGLRELRGRWRPAIGAALAVIMVVGFVALYPALTAHPTPKSYLVGLVDR